MPELFSRDFSDDPTSVLGSLTEAGDANQGVTVPLVITANILLAAIMFAATVGMLGSAIRTPRQPQPPTRVKARNVNEPHPREAGAGARAALAPQA